MLSEDTRILYENIYKEVEAISKALRNSIKHMPKYNRYLVGDRIVSLLVDIKLEVKLALVAIDYKYDTIKLYNLLITLGILIDDQIEDGGLLLKGKYTVHEPRMRLASLLLMLKDILPQDGCST